MSTFVISNFKPIAAGSLRGFIDVTQPPGMVLHRCGIFVKEDKAWDPGLRLLRRGWAKASEAERSRFLAEHGLA